MVYPELIQQLGLVRAELRRCELLRLAVWAAPVCRALQDRITKLHTELEDAQAVAARTAASEAAAERVGNLHLLNRTRIVPWALRGSAAHTAAVGERRAATKVT